MLTITLEQVGLRVDRVPTPNGEMRLLRLTDAQSGITVQVVFDDAGWAGLMSGGSGIKIANGLPPQKPQG